MSQLSEDVEVENGAVDLVTTSPAPNRGVRTVDAGVLVEGVFELFRTILGEALKPEVVDELLKKAQKQPAVKAMMTKIKVKGAGGAKGPALMRSNYNMFVQDFFHHLKAAGVQSTIMEVGTYWKVLPSDVKEGLNARYNAVKATYNAKVKDGQAANLADEMSAYAAAHNLPPVDYIVMYNQYRGAAAAAAGSSAAAAAGAAAATPGRNRAKAAAPAAPSAAAAATPAAAAPAEGGKRAAEGGEAEHKHSHKKHKKDKEKKEKESAAGTEEKKKKKKHKSKEGAE